MIDRGWFREDNAHNVEPDAVPMGLRFSSVLTRDAQQMRSLILSDGALRRPEFGCFPRLYLDEYQGFSFPGDQIRFRIAR